MTAGSLPISETFVSIQGEGKLTGVPSWFCRVSGCNLRCTWCDTPYASWAPEGGRRSVDDLVAEARGSGVRHAVLTGGEPMMFEEIAEVARGVRLAGMHVTIETAGTIDREVELDLLSVSPKLGSSTPMEGDARDPLGVWRERHEARRIDPAVLQALLDRAPDRQLKFVVNGAADLAEIEGVLGLLRGWKAEEVLLMPEGVGPPEAGFARWVAAACVERGWRYCHRVHIEVYGHTRGT